MLGIKKLITTTITFIIVIIIILGGAFLYNKFVYSKTYKEVEDIMITAAKSYIKDNKSKLPLNTNGTITIKVKTLIEEEKMKKLDNYLKNTSCTGEVKVTNINGTDYRYTPILNCKDKYKTKTLIEYINENVEIVTNHNGLYNENDTLVYRGEVVNNYLKLNGKQYRIVKFVNGQAVIILTEETESIAWDNHYNLVTDSNSGINNYDVSSINNYLQSLYKANGENSLLTNRTRLLTTSHAVPIGKKCNADTDKSGSIENAVTLENQYISLLPLYDYQNASLDENCTNSNSKSCGNYNYLAKYKYNWWTATANSKNTYYSYAIIDRAPISTKNSELAYVRPVLYLTSNAIYVRGDGSKSNPFIVK